MIRKNPLHYNCNSYISYCFLLNLNALNIRINFGIYIYFLVNIQAFQVWPPEGINCRLQLVSFRICWQHSFRSKNMISNLSSAVLEWSNSKNWHTIWYTCIAFVAIIYCYLLYYYLLYFVFYVENTNVWLYWRITELSEESVSGCSPHKDLLRLCSVLCHLMNKSRYASLLNNTMYVCHVFTAVHHKGPYNL